MHAAWDVAEVRNMILTYLASGDVARLGRTCKAIHDYVIDHLWQDIRSFDGFLQLLPAYPRTEPLTVNDLERIDFYGRKVRRLDLTTGDRDPKLQIPQTMRTPRKKVYQKKIPASDHPWIELWEEIALLRPQTAFLPNLQYLVVNNAAAELLRPLVGISGARLQSIYIKAVHEPKDLLRKLLGGFEETPKLEYLRVRNGLHQIPDALIENSPLITLRLDETAASNYRPPLPLSRALLMRSSLKFLTVSLHESWHDSESWRAINEKILPALRQLRLNLQAINGIKCHEDCSVCALSWTGNDPLRRQRVRNRSFFLRPDPPCKRRPPSVFICGLDHPRLELLNVKFNSDADAALLLDTMHAFVETCCLDNLVELALSNGGWLPPYSYHPGWNKPKIRGDEIREMLDVLGPLPRLRVLRLPLACDFLRVLDVQYYKRVAEAMPALQALTLGHRSFASISQYSEHFYDLTPLKHVAAFCHLFPALRDVEIGCIDATSLGSRDNPEWACFNVRRICVNLWLRSNDLVWERQLQECRAYFPNADVGDELFRPYYQVRSTRRMTVSID